MNMEKFDRRILKYIIWLVLAVLAILYFKQGLAALVVLFHICAPLVMGCVIAYALNIVLKLLERIYFPRSKKALVLKTKRPVCILLSLGLVSGVIVLVTILVVPEFLRAFILIAKEIPVYFESFKSWLRSYSDQYPMIADTVQGMNIEWDTTLKQFAQYALSGVGSVFSSAITFVATLGSGVLNVAVGIIFAIFILSQKEKLKKQVQTLLTVFIKSEHTAKLTHVLSVANDTFTRFIAGQCLEALILGSLCLIGMLIFRFPYAAMISAVVGVTALIPVVGSFVGVGVGAFMILTVDPLSALLFIIFLLVLQQIEGNLIYPKVVGSSVGLPGMWVLAAIIIGGGVGGVVGMILGVPLSATLYKLLQESVRKNLQTKKAASSAE